MEKFRIRDLGWEKVGSGINIPDPQHCFFFTSNTNIATSSDMDRVERNWAEIEKFGTIIYFAS
jgi:hypothetical protein